MSVFDIMEQKASGLVLGTASHALGTTRALEESEEMGAISGTAVVLTGLFTAIVAPLLWKLL